MGTIYEYKCECGYVKEAFQGAGMASFKRKSIIASIFKGHKKFHFEAAICKDCNELIVINNFDKKHKCHECKGKNVTTYKEPDLIKNTTKIVKERKKVWIGKGEEPIQFLSLDEDDDDEMDKKELERYSDEKNWKTEYIEVTEDVTYYLCPKCNQFLMERLKSGHWD